VNGIFFKGRKDIYAWQQIVCKMVFTEMEVNSMKTQVKRLTVEALNLTPSERETFVELLLISQGTDVSMEEALNLEVEHRLAAHQRRMTPVVHSSDAVTQVYTSLAD
jgi:hypothetical protein